MLQGTGSGRSGPPDAKWDARTKDILMKLMDGKAKAEEEARSWKEECANANMKLEATAAELQKVKGKLKQSINAMEMYKQSTQQLIIKIEKDRQLVEQSIIQMEKEKQSIMREFNKNR